jgi:hypothetical protein
MSNKCDGSDSMAMIYDLRWAIWCKVAIRGIMVICVLSLLNRECGMTYGEENEDWLLASHNGSNTQAIMNARAEYERCSGCYGE